ncbi:MAG: S-formylglutathione hydrolase [Alphaproteobacteria bacterium]|nr:MAG: S-formylglutathione hydrolase [Alphaproteobacteria bacterium]
MGAKIEKTHFCHGGQLYYCSHDSRETGTQMRFSLFLPPQASGGTPYVIFLSGLTCTEDNFTTKAGAYAKAAALGIAVLAPDTSPRGEDVADDDAYDLGQGAGFYLDALQEPWKKHFRMESYLVSELLPLAEQSFGLDPKRKSITGHSMGGHGALTLYFRHPGLFQSCSAFAPIVAPAQVPWGQKAFTAYLGDSRETWLAHDATELVSKAATEKEILIDQGLADPFLEEQLQPELFQTACNKVGQKLTLRLQDGYDHSYFFIQSFIGDHLKFHANNF